MSHGGDFSERSSDAARDEAAESSLPAPPIRGVVPLDPGSAAKSPSSFFDESAGPSRPAGDPNLFDGLPERAADDQDLPASHALDPWGVQEQGEEESEADADPLPEFPRRGGGTLTIPLICIGVTMIACVTLLPMADDLHQLAWEREKLKADLVHLKEQVRVNEEFLARVADDPTLAERLAQRQMKMIRDGQRALPVRAGGREEMSPFQLVNVPPPPPMPAYQPVGGGLATLVRAPRSRMYLSGGGLLLVAIGLVLGYVPREDPRESEE